MTFQYYKFGVLFVFLVTLQRAACQPSYPPGAGAGGGSRYPGRPTGYPGPEVPGGNYGAGVGAGGERGMYPPPRPGSGGFPGPMGRGSSGPAAPPWPMGESQGEPDVGGEEGAQPSGYSGLGWPEDTGIHPHHGLSQQPPLPPLDDSIDQASAPRSSHWFPDSFQPMRPGEGTGLGPSINEGTHQESTDHTDDTGIDDNDSDTGTHSDLKAGANESVKSHSIRQNVTVAETPDDDFNYLAMYITVAICITFMVTLVAIALIRGPQGPFKTKRTDEEISRGLAGSPAAEDVFVLSDGGATSRTDAQWEHQPLRGDCDDVETDLQAGGGEMAAANDGSTAITVTGVSSKGEAV